MEAGASVTRTLHGQYTNQPAVPESFTLNGKRCDATVIAGVAPGPQEAAIAAPPSAAAAVPAWDKTSGKSGKPHGKQPKGQGT